MIPDSIFIEGGGLRIGFKGEDLANFLPELWNKIRTSTEWGEERNVEGCYIECQEA